MSNLRNLRVYLAVFVFLLLLWVIIPSCSVIRLQRLKNCEFTFERLEDLSIAGVNIKKLESINDLSFSNGAKILAALSSGTLAADFRIVVAVSNPNKAEALMETFEYKVLLDDKEVLNGNSKDRTVIPGNGKAELSVSAKLNIAELLHNKSLNELVELAKEMKSGNGFSDRIKLKIKPNIRVGKKDLKYPGFIDIRIGSGK